VHSDTCVMQCMIGLLVIAGQRAAAGAAGAAAAGSRARAGGAARFPAGCHGGDGCSCTLRSRGGWAAAGAGSQPQQPGAAVTVLRLGTKRAQSEHWGTLSHTVPYLCVRIVGQQASAGARLPRHFGADSCSGTCCNSCNHEQFWRGYLAAAACNALRGISAAENQPDGWQQPRRQ
jgi:hypothetical protein